jgi:hypothetical protein
MTAPIPPFTCQTCGKPARYGFNVTLRSRGSWFCPQHKPEGW